MSAVRLRWQKIVNQLKFLYNELRLCKEMGDVGGPEFQQYYEKFCDEHQIDLAELNSRHQSRLNNIYGREEILQDNAPPPATTTALAPHQTDSDQQAEFDKLLGEVEAVQTDVELHETFCRVFRKLAHKLHPDRQPPEATATQKAQKMELFKEAKTALDERRYYVLIELALQFEIEPPKNYQQQVGWMQNEIKVVSQRLGEAMGSYNYLFVECENDQQRDDLIRMFLKHLFDLNL